MNKTPWWKYAIAAVFTLPCLGLLITLFALGLCIAGVLSGIAITEEVWNNALGRGED